MDFKAVTTVSKWTTQLKHVFCDTGSDKLIIAMPGLGYTHEKPLFYYLVSLAQEKGFDLFNLSYGFQATKAPFSKEDNEDLNVENYLAISALELSRYKQVVIVAKSLGTFFAHPLSETLSTNWPDIELSHVLLTPLSSSIPDVFSYKTLVIYGSADDLIDEKAIRKAHLNAWHCETITGANHSLTTGNSLEDIDILKRVYQLVSNFISLENNIDIQQSKSLSNIYLKPVLPSDYSLLADTLDAAHALYSPLMGDAFIKLADKYRQTGPTNPEHYWQIRKSFDSNSRESEYMGFMAFENLPKDMVYLIGLYLMPNRREQGIGKRVLERLEGYLKSTGAKTMLLQAHQDAHWAVGFYTHNGYKVTGKNLERLGPRTLKNTVVFEKQL